MNRNLLRLTDPDAPLRDMLAVVSARDRLPRRRLLQALGAATVALSPLRALACSIIPSETGGPYPGDGTNGPNVLTQSGVVRSDIRASFGSAGSAIAAGTPITVTLQLVNANDNCAPLPGYAVYLWHCDAQGRYSMYSSGVTGENYLRGVQVSDANGRVTFTTIYPGAYSGRWPHIHFEVYRSVGLAVAGANAVKTSQLALPEATSRAVYAQTALYPSSLANLDRTPLRSDNVFGDDGAALQLAAVTGSLAGGYAASLEVGIAGTAGTSTAPAIDQHGLTGLWYEPATSGQGLALEVFAATGTASAYLQGGWFTFDVAPAGGVDRQRWYTFGGPIGAGGSTATLPLYRNVGGNFNAAPVTTSEVVGSVTLSFSSCTSGELAYTMTDGRGGSIPLSRLTPNLTCSTTSERPTQADFALSGNWYDPATSGQGFIIEVNPSAPVVFFAWYTYAASGQGSGAAGQRWYTGQAAYAAGSRTASVALYETTGGVFDTPTPSGQATAQVGSATLSFSSCNAASLSFAFNAGSNAGRSGTIDLQRVGRIPVGCTVG